MTSRIAGSTRLSGRSGLCMPRTLQRNRPAEHPPATARHRLALGSPSARPPLPCVVAETVEAPQSWRTIPGSSHQPPTEDHLYDVGIVTDAGHGHPSRPGDGTSPRSQAIPRSPSQPARSRPQNENLLTHSTVRTKTLQQLDSSLVTQPSFGRDPPGSMTRRVAHVVACQPSWLYSTMNGNVICYFA